MENIVRLKTNTHGKMFKIVELKNGYKIYVYLLGTDDWRFIGKVSSLDYVNLIIEQYDLKHSST